LVVSLPLDSGAAVYQYFDEEGTLVVTGEPHGRGSGAAESAKRFVPYKLPVSHYPDVAYEFYEVSGGDFAGLVADMRARGPMGRDGKRYPAETSWRFGLSYDFNYSYEEDGSVVRASIDIFNVVLTYDIRVLLPALREGAGLSPHDSGLWDAVLNDLIEHEHDHVALVKDPAQWESAISRISAVREIAIPYQPGSDIGRAIEAAVEARTAAIVRGLTEAVRERNEEYDRVTEHGVKKEMREAFFAR